VPNGAITDLQNHDSTDDVHHPAFYLEDGSASPVGRPEEPSELKAVQISHRTSKKFRSKRYITVRFNVP